MTGELEVKVMPLYLGLGYPAGYRSLQQALLVVIGDKAYELDVYTVIFHKERHFFEEEYYAENCRLCSRTFNNFWGKKVDTFLEEIFKIRVEQAFGVYTDFPELSYKDIEWLVKNFVLNLMPDIGAVKIVWGGSGKEKELQHWEKDRARRIKWLKEGAPPYSMGIAPDALDNLPEEEKEVFKDVFEEMGFEEKEDGSLHKKAEVIKEDLLAEVVERRLLKIATAEKEDGEIYLSPASWPGLGLVVAGGKRYLIHHFDKESYKERCWIGYLRNKKILVLFESKGSGCKELKIDSDPDFLEAMTLVYRPQ